MSSSVWKDYIEGASPFVEEAEVQWC